MASGVAGLPALAREILPAVQVFKSPTCGCCGAWVDHMKAAGFAVTVTEVDDTSVARRKHGLPDRFGSCHTAVVAGYAVEGHVPANDVKKLLAIKPLAIGLAVPGCPWAHPAWKWVSARTRIRFCSSPRTVASVSSPPTTEPRSSS